MRSSGPQKRSSETDTRLPRNVPRKVIGAIRRKGEKKRGSGPSTLPEEQFRLCVHSFSYEIALRKLHKKKLAKQRNDSISGTLLEHQKNSHLELVKDFSSSNLVGSSNNSVERYSIDEKLTSSDDETCFGKPSEEDFGRMFARSISQNHSPALAEFDVMNAEWEAEAFYDVLHLRRKKRTTIERAHLAKSKSQEYGSSLNILSDTDNENKASMYNQHSDPDLEADDEGDHPNFQAEEPVEEHFDAFLFCFGSVVLWNFESEDEELYFMESLRHFLIRPYKEAELLDQANDSMGFTYGGKSSVKHDLIHLGTREPEEKLAVSYALAQSNLLSVYEWRLDQIISRNEYIPQELASTGKIRMNQTEIAKEVGKLFMERNSINLGSDVLDIPVFFWENDEWDPVYTMLCKYLEHSNRIDVLNRRLDCVHELLEVLQSQTENQHASRLEWIIIWLITCELVVQVIWNILIKDIFGLFEDKED